MSAQLRSRRLMLALLSANIAVPVVAVADPVASAHQHASAPATLASPLAVPVDTASLTGLPRELLTTRLDGTTLQCQGFALSTLLRSAGALGEKAAEAALASYVLVTARDGHRVVLSLGELDPALGKPAVFLVDRCQGQPLDPRDGPLRLIAPTEKRDARWLRQVQSITVVAAP